MSTSTREQPWRWLRNLERPALESLASYYRKRLAAVEAEITKYPPTPQEGRDDANDNL